MRIYVSGSLRFRDQMASAVAALKDRGFDCSMSEQIDPRGIIGCFEKIERADALFVCA